MGNMMQTIRDLEKFSPRQGPNETLTRVYLQRRLTDLGIDFETQEFDNLLPKARSYSLVADGEKIECMPTAFRSGEIEGKPLISSMDVSGRYYEKPNINFNPYAELFSLATFYRAPSLTIRRRDVQKLLNAETVEGKVKVSKQKHRSANLVLGNVKNPKSVLICHYDSVLGGALDNGSGTAVLLEIAEMEPKDRMIVFSGCEEFSFEGPAYWGKGYRELEKGFKRQLQGARNIIVADMLGSSSPAEVTDPTLRIACFPVKDPRTFERARMASVSGKEWLPIYHSRGDTTALIKPNFLKQGLDFVLSLSGK
jgi:Iap family predicted aminopeptidase